MWKEINLDGEGWARGRNGYFVPRKIEVFKDVRGKINLSVASNRPGKVDPISLRVSKDEARRLASVLNSLAGNQKEMRVVVVVEGGNVQSIFASHPDLHFVKVDYDVEGTPRGELRRVLQDCDNGKKSYELASVRHWGEAEVCPQWTNRFFKNARD
jgi:hypothetical protein